VSDMAWSGRESVLRVLVGAGICVAALAFGYSGVPVLPALIALPAIALLMNATPQVAAVIGGVALLAMIPLSIGTPTVPAITRLTAACFAAGVTVVACWHRHYAGQARAELSAAVETMQRALLRPVPRRVGMVRAEASYMPAGRAWVGGDLYDVVGTPHGVRLIIGDVMGKGHDAVERAADVLGAFRELAYHEETLPGVAIRLDAFLSNRGESEQFVTALLAEIPEPLTATQSVPTEFVSCGHPPPLLLANGTATFAESLSPSPPLGLMDLGTDWCTSSFIDLVPGNQLLLYTDGFSEARDANGTFYPLADRTSFLWEPDQRLFVDRLTEDLRDYADGELHDDAALLLIRFEPSVVPASVGEGERSV